MARLNICGFQTGDFSECSASSGTVSVQSTTKRTGTYALRSNPSAAGFGYAQIGGLTATGTSTNAAISAATLWGRFYFRIAALPASNNIEIVSVLPSGGGAQKATLYVTPAGRLRLVDAGGTGTTGSGFIMPTGTWVRLELKVGTGASGAAWEIKADGAVEISGTGNLGATNGGSLGLGDLVANAPEATDRYYADVSLDNAAYPGAGQVNILKPNATGTTSAWTNGAGTSPTNVAEVPHDSDTGYITSSTNGNVTTVNLDSSATGGVSGTIAATKVVGIVRDEGGASSMSIRAKSGATNSDTTAVDPGSTYTALAEILATDPNTSAAWTTGGLDALEIGVVNSANVAVRCTALYAMVECSGAVAATGYTNLPLMGVG